MPEYARIPDELKALRQWVCWRNEERIDQHGAITTTKVPINARSRSGAKASSTAPATWSTFEKAVKSANERAHDGIGFVFTRDDPYVGIDLDANYDGAENAIDVVEAFGSYAETSPSGTGIHIVGRATLPEERGRHPKGVGVFGHSRYFTFTGDVLEGYTAITDIQAALDRAWPRWFPERPPVVTPPPVWIADDEDILHRLRMSANGAKFAALYDAGDVSPYSGNASEADLALLSLMTFYTQDPGQLDRLFRGSRLYRAKWEREDYRALTISRALERSDYYDPGLNGASGSITYTNGSVSAESGQKTTTSGSIPGESGSVTRLFNPTDLGNARRLVALHGSDLRYCHERVKWLVWDGKSWHPDESGEIMRRAKAVIPAIHAEAGAATTKKQRDTLLSWAKTSESRSRLESTIRLAESEPGIPVPIGSLDADPWLLNVENGVLDLRNGELLPHAQERMLTKIAPVSYSPDAHCPVWKQFLNDIMEGREELVGFTQRALGYSLTGDVGERSLFILHGSGRNGKSTLLETVNAILGDYALRSPTDLLVAKRGDSGIPNDVARLPGVRFTFASETNEFARLDEAKVKDLVGGDTLSARFMRGEFFDFRPEFKLWLGTNHRPTIRGTDEAIWDRIKLIPFDVRIPEDRVDRSLKAKLWAERSGILNWMLQGCLAWQRSGLGEPQAVTEAVRAYRDTMDMIGAFLSEECVVREGASELATTLYKGYREWAEANGERPISQRMFGMRLAERGYASQRFGKNRNVHYFGIRLKLGSDTDHPVYDTIEDTFI